MRYEDIINHPHHEPLRHPRMPMRNRAAQFSPFAAVTGHSGAVQEAGRFTESQVFLDEERIQELNEQLREIIESGDRNHEVLITFFVPDQRKDGGHYRKARGIIGKADPYRQVITLLDGTAIQLKHIVKIEDISA